MSGDLAAFVLARIADDEAVARGAMGVRDDGQWHVGPGMHAESVNGECITIYAEGGHDHDQAVHIARWDPARVLAECQAKRAIVALAAAPADLGEWEPDCGGDWCLSGGAPEGDPGVGYFANYWPDNTVLAVIYRDGIQVTESGISAHRSKAECQAFAERWIRQHLPSVSPVLRALAAVYADHPDYAWRP